MPLFLPIKQRALRKGPEVEEDPITRKISNGVLILATGLLIILVGIFISVIGNRKGSSQFRLYAGIVIIIVGFVTSLSGGIIYTVFWRRKNSNPVTVDAEANSPEGSNSCKMLTRGASEDELSDNEERQEETSTQALANEAYACEMKNMQKKS